MIGEIVAAGGTLRDGIITSIQTGKDDLESILLALQLNKNIWSKQDLEYIRFTSEVLTTLE
jgi:nitric oxide reductase NorQ protein